VDLFCARCGLAPNEEIAELCARLDWLPLAVELAAARTRALSVSQIAERLSGRLDLLKGGRDADPRQQTLHATIEWSYELLTPDEQTLFGRLSVFAGGCTLEAAEELCAADLDTLQLLVEESLLRFTPSKAGGRYWMLETIREYAGERLEDAGEEDEMRERHFGFLSQACRVVGTRALGTAHRRLPPPTGSRGGQPQGCARLERHREHRAGCPPVGGAVALLGDPSPAEGSSNLAQSVAWLSRSRLTRVASQDSDCGWPCRWVGLRLVRVQRATR